MIVTGSVNVSSQTLFCHRGGDLFGKVAFSVLSCATWAGDFQGRRAVSLRYGLKIDYTSFDNFHRYQYRYRWSRANLHG